MYCMRDDIGVPQGYCIGEDVASLLARQSFLNTGSPIFPVLYKLS